MNAAQIGVAAASLYNSYEFYFGKRKNQHMTFNLTVNCYGDAFYGEEKHAELARILREIADALEERGGLMGNVVFDINGNRAGRVTFE